MRNPPGGTIGVIYLSYYNIKTYLFGDSLIQIVDLKNIRWNKPSVRHWIPMTPLSDHLISSFIPYSRSFKWDMDMQIYTPPRERLGRLCYAASFELDTEWRRRSCTVRGGQRLERESEHIAKTGLCSSFPPWTGLVG